MRLPQKLLDKELPFVEYLQNSKKIFFTNLNTKNNTKWNTLAKKTIKIIRQININNNVSFTIFPGKNWNIKNKNKNNGTCRSISAKPTSIRKEKDIHALSED